MLQIPKTAKSPSPVSPSTPFDSVPALPLLTADEESQGVPREVTASVKGSFGIDRTALRQAKQKVC
ncbi:MAG: hypothetical protein ACO331_06370 [Prochlorothrix sp.]